MKKIFCYTVLLFALFGCKGSEEDINSLNLFFTDLSKVYTSEFNKHGADDITKINFAVKKMYLDNPEKFQEAGKRIYSIDSASINNLVSLYFTTPIKKPQNTVDVDFTKEGRYEIMKFESNELVFSQIEKIVAEKNDSLLLEVNVYSCDKNFKGDIYSSPELWQTQDSEIIPSFYKKMRAVVVRRNNGFRVVSYSATK